MIGQKTMIAAAVILAILCAFLVAGISYVSFPSEASQQPIPGPRPKPGDLLSQFAWVILLISLAALVAALIAIMALILNRRKRHNSSCDILRSKLLRAKYLRFSYSVADSFGKIVFTLRIRLQS